MEIKKLKKNWNKFWFVVWKDDSFIGWILSIIFIFIIIKFIFFPVLNFVTGTELPLAIVESCSMYHQGPIPNFNEWWNKHQNKYLKYDIGQQNFIDYRFTNGFNKGDILFVIGANPDKLEIGDVIIFDAKANHPIIHRIISIKEEDGKRIFSTLGDNNKNQLTGNNNPSRIDETHITEDQIRGKAIIKVAPFLGWGKLIWFEPGQDSNNKGFCDEN